MYLLIEDPEWLQLRQEEILAIENYNRDREWLLWVAACRADLASGEELRGCVKRLKKSVLHLEDVRRQIAHLYLTYSAKVEVYKTIARQVEEATAEVEVYKLIARQVEEATAEVAALVPPDHLPLDFQDALWVAQTLAD